MTNTVDRAWVVDLIRRNRYLVLSTTAGDEPWIAPLEYLFDADLNFYFFSPEAVRHSQHIERNNKVAVAIFDSQQPDYTSEPSFVINGIQVEATASKLNEAEYPDVVVSAISAMNIPMPPYAVFKIRANQFYVPRIDDGVNVRVEVDIE